MGYKTLLTILTEVDDATTLLDTAISMASAEGAHLDVMCLAIDRTQTGYYFAGATALMHDETLQQARAEAARIEDAAKRRLQAEDVPYALDSVVAQTAVVSTVVSRRARFSDVVILPKPYGEGLPADAPAVIEAAMFQGGVPVIMTPAGTECPHAPDRVVLAWNESDEALAAARAALPLLRRARLVDILVVDPVRHEADRADPGATLSTFLSRHGARVEMSIIAQTTTRVSDTIKRHCTDRGADLLVMGAYGHSRFREAILGGATRNMLEHADIPVLMAH